MARRSVASSSLVDRLREVELRTWEQSGMIIRRIGIEVSWAKIADVMISGTGVESSDYDPDVEGWMIDGDGNAEFNGAVIRGTLNASDIVAGTLSADRIAAGSISPAKLDDGETGAITITLGSGGKIQSTDTDPDIVINGDGSAVFKNVEITGTLKANSIAGDLIMTTDGAIKTGTSAPYITIADEFNATIRFYFAASDYHYIEGGTGILTIASSDENGSVDNSFITLVSDGVDVPTIEHHSANHEFLGTGLITDPLYARILSKGIHVVSGTEANPSISFFDDANTGIYNPVNNQLAITIAGNQELLIGATGFLVPNVYGTDQTGGSTVYVDSADGRLHVNLSARRTKADITPADYLEDIVLSPVRFRKKDSDVFQYGQIADDLAAQDPLLGIYDEHGEISDFVDRATVAVLIAKVNRLEKKVGV